MALDDLLRDIQKMKDLAQPVRDLIPFTEKMEALRQPFKHMDALAEVAGIFDQNLHVLNQRGKFDKSHAVWNQTGQELWSGNLFAKDLDRFQIDHVFSQHLYKGIALSKINDLRFYSPLAKAFFEREKNPQLYTDKNSLDNFIASSAWSNTSKSSRVISAYLAKNQKLLKIDYDLAAIGQTAEGQEADEYTPSGIITPRKIIKEAKTIKHIIQDIYRDNANLFKLRSRRFEEVIAELLDRKGYNVELTKQTRDGGYDILALSLDNGMPLKYLVECKRYARNRPVGIELIRSFSDVMNQEQANKGIIFTTSYFTTGARQRQKTKPNFLQLNDHDEVVNWVKDYILSF